METLEPRLLLDAQSGDGGQVSSEWFASFVNGFGKPQSQNYAQATAVDRSWIVQLSDTALDQLSSVADVPRMLRDAQLPVFAVRGLGLPGQLLVESDGDIAAVEAALRASPFIAQANKNGVLEGEGIPNDPKFPQQLALHDPVGDFDINAPPAWSISQGSKDVVVAVIDSGIDYGHPDLADNIWQNNKEIAGNGIDDDNNHFIDDVRGFDFVNGDIDPMDDNGHGTNVAGIIGAVGNNGVGIAGVNWFTSMIPLKYLNQDNVGTRDNAVTAINYATLLRQKGVNIQVINASWGDYGDFYQPMYDAIKAAGDAGILFVAAAGNGNSLGRGIDLDHERTAFYPASYDLDNIVTVGASAPDLTLASFSNFGETSVDLLAPGVGILTTDRTKLYAIPGNAYALRSGTSFAAPFVTGTAALVAEARPGVPMSEIREALLKSTRPNSKLGTTVATAGVLTAQGALNAQTFAPRATATAISKVTTPGAVVTISVTFKSDVALAADSIDGSEVRIDREHYQGNSQIATFVPGSMVFVTPNEIRAKYRITIADSRDNGDYQVVLLGEHVRDVNGLAAGQRVLVEFKVAIEDSNLIEVNSTADIASASLPQGTMTLRAAIQRANATPGNQTILLRDGNYLLSIRSAPGEDEDSAALGDLDIVNSTTDALGTLSIIGSGNSFIRIDAQGLSRIFDVHAGASLSLAKITIAGGRETVGAGIRNASARFGENPGVKLTQTVVTQNVATIAGGGLANLVGARMQIFASSVDGNSTTSGTTSLGGGGIYNAGALLGVYSSTVSNNSSAAGFTGGGGGGLFNDQTGFVDVVSSTFSGNVAARGRGGGIFNTRTARIARATLVDNRALRGGAIYNAPEQIVTIRASVLARSIGAVNDADGTFTSRGYNFIGLASSATLGFNTQTDRFDPGSSIPLDPKLGPLVLMPTFSPPTADRPLPVQIPGLTRIHLPLPGSPLLDAGDPNETSPDQVGYTTTINGTFNRADIGAAERYLGALAGVAFNDLNGNRSRDPNEPGLPGIKVYLDLNKNSVFDPGEFFTFTKADDPTTLNINEAGTAAADVLPNFDLLVSLETPAGFEPTTAGTLSTVLPVTITKLADSLAGVNGSLSKFSDPAFTAVDADGTISFMANTPQGLQYFIGKDDVFAMLPASGTAAYDGSQLEEGRLAFTSRGTFSDGGTTYGAGVYVREPNGTLKKLADAETIVPDRTVKFGSAGFFEPRISDGIVLFHTETGIVSQAGVFASSESGDLFRIDSLSGSSLGSRFLDADIDGNDYAVLTPQGIWARGVDSSMANIVPHGSAIPGGGAFDFNLSSALALSNGRVSFLAHGNNGEWGVYRRPVVDGAAVQLLADLHTTIPGRTGNFTGFGTELSSDGDCTVFLGEGASGLRGIYASIGGQLRKIVDTGGDKFQGSRITNLNIGSDALNGNRIGFTAKLADGRTVVMMATIPYSSQRSILLRPGQERLNLVFGFSAIPGSIRGTVFEDKDLDAIPDGTDVRLQAWTVFLDQNDNQQFDRGEMSTLTNARGEYALSNLPSLQTYHVRVQLQGAHNVFYASSADDDHWTVNLDAGENRDQLNFATVIGDEDGVANQGKLKGRIYTDANGNKVFDAGEERVKWTVFIDQNNNRFPDNGELSTLTQSNNPNTPENEGGTYEFAELPAGAYNIRAMMPANFSQVTPPRNELTPRSSTDTIRAPSALEVGDIDRDGDLDLVAISNELNTVAISTNGGNGAFKPGINVSNIGASPSAVAIGDLDGKDGPDIVVANQYGSALSVLFNTGSKLAPFTREKMAKFAAGGSLGYANVRGLAIGNFDGKGGLDVATANDLAANNVTIYLNSLTSPGTLTVNQVLSAGAHAFAIAAVNLDSDTDTDLVISNYVDGTISLLRNNGAGVFTAVGSPIRVGSAPSSIAIGNFDGKGGQDIAVANYSSNNVSILFSTGNFTFTAPRSIYVPSGATSIVAGDLDSDHDTDLIVAAGQTGATGGVSILRNRGGGRFGAAETRGVGFLGEVAKFNVAVGKLDADGTLDLVVTDGFRSKFSLLTNQILKDGTHQVELRTGVATNVVGGLDFLVKQEQTKAPTLVVLVPQFDTGISQTDNLTFRNNIDGTKLLQFIVRGTIPGAVVRLYAGDKFIGSATAKPNTTTTVVTTNGKLKLADGLNEITARQQLSGQVQSFRSQALKIRIDTVAPAKPGRPDLAFASDNGSSGTDNVTSLKVLSFSGTAAPNTRIRLFRNGVGIVTADVNSLGKDLVSVGGFTVGTHSITVKSIDAAGNFSVVSDPLTPLRIVASAAIPAARLANSPRPKVPTAPQSIDSQDSLFTQLAEEGWESLSCEQQ